ncbi:MAG: DNRLRE domain-containing protein [Eubacterium sp.]|nr:DNRLRE domain-containing protein [Eubacterium sp.]
MNLFYRDKKNNLKLTTKVISVILSVLIFFSAFPIVSLADEIPETENENNEPVVVQELEEERNENTKHFLMSDQTVKAVVYSEPVHYEENGKWLDIDNSLEYEKETSDDDFNGYKTKNGDFDVKFAKNANSSKLITISKDKYSLSWNLLNKAKAISGFKKIDIEEADKDAAEIEKSVSNTSQSVCYENIIADTDLEYTVNGNGLKENIIVKKPADSYTYSFEISAKHLTLSLQEDNSILASDSKSGECVYTIPAMFMIDSNGKYSNDISVSLEQKNKNKYILNIDASSDWINEEDRAFPVIIDPQITTQQVKKNIFSTYVESGDATRNHNLEELMMVGKTSVKAGKCRGFIQFTLPSLKKGDMVVDATLHLGQTLVDYYASTTPNAQINAYMVTGGWKESTITWSNQPACESTALDYNFINKSEKGKAVWKEWNITKAVKKWYEGTSANNGIMLKSTLENVSSMIDSCIYAWYYTESGPSSTSTAYPLISITYRNNKGLEPYWTYTSASAGSAGTASVNDYSGNLVFSRTDCATTGLRMPVSIEHVYNGYMAKTTYKTTKPYVGHGWKLNIQQTVAKTSLDKFPYVYEDGDGTQHYFYKKTANGKTQYLDEDGLKLELKISSSGYTITDEKDNVLTFNSKGFLTSSKDANGNTMKITFNTADATKIESVTDGSGHVIKLLDNTETKSGYLQYMVDPSGRKTNFKYDNGKLIRVKYPDGKEDTYAYDADEALTLAKASTGYSLNFSYTSLAKGKRVSKILEKGDTTAGQTVTFDRSAYNTTVIRTAGVDDVYGNSDDIYTTYQFDNWGKTISKQSKTASGNLGAEVYNYTASEVDGSASNIKYINQVNSSAAYGRNIINLAKNSNAESTKNWKLLRWIDDCDASFGTTTAQKYYGQSSFKLTSNSVTGDGRARIYQDFKLDDIIPGKTYTLSAYVKTSNIQKANSNTFGACLALYAETGNTETSKQEYSEFLTGTTDTAMDNGWRRISATITVPQDVMFLRANLAIKSATGTAYFDGIQVEQSGVANHYNMIENSSFERSANNLPENWTGQNLTLSDSVDGISPAYKYGSSSFRFVGGATAQKKLIQEVNISGSENDTYIVSGWARAEAVPATSTNRKFQISVEVCYSDGTSKYKMPAVFNPSVSGWQYTSYAFTLSDGTSAVKTPVKIKVHLGFFNQVNKGYFDGIQLIKDVANSYTYDSNGNLISVAANAQQKSKMEYTNSDLTKSTDPKGYSYTYTYDKNHNVTQASSQRNVKYNYTYSQSGSNPLTLDITNSGGTMSLKSAAGYSDQDTSKKIWAGAYLTSTGDQDDYRTFYSYDILTGNLKSAKNPNDTMTYYTYNAQNDALTSVSSNGITNNYTYENSRLKSIAHNGMTYSFNYDKFGNTTQTKAGSYTLSTNTYAANNGKLAKTTYGNGYYTSNNYNSYGQVTSVAKNGSTKYSWAYDASSKPILHKDYENKLNYYYTYDTTGRLIRSNVYKQGVNSNTNSRVYTVEQSYDMNNNVSKIVQSAGSISPYQKYSYGKDNLPDVYTMFSNRTQTYTFDSLNRYSKMELSLDKPVTINYIYHLSERNTDSSEKYRTTKLKCEFINNTAYRYNYDKLGNIVQVEQGTRVEGTNSGTNYSANLKYEYDALSQLTRENNKYLNQTITYTYDKGGNITKKTIYPYTAGSLNGVAPTQTIVYNYGNSSWTDLLTSYNGQNITYDAIGNPTSYLGYTLKWNGRQLSSLSGNGTTASYKYDADGLRSYKKVNGVETTYQYVGDKLMYEKRGTTEFYYYYNSFGNLAGIKYIQNGTEYMVYAVCNMRGDVEDLYWGSGNLACHYTYDTWGNVISVTDINGKEITNANHIGLMNPIRYRGYYFDSEIGMYYLQSRYYNPQVGRFISADGQLNNDLLGNNLFTYCGNNPVTRSDDDGQGWWIAAGAIVGALISGGTKIVSNVMSGTKWYDGVAGALVGGAVSGAITAATCNTTAAAFAGAAAESVTNQLLSYIPTACKAVGQDKPTKVNKRNVLVSVGTVAAETVVYGLASKGAGKIAQKVIPINSGWFKPQKFSSCFSGNYAHKFQGQTLLQSSMVAGADSIKQMVEKVVDTVMGQEPTFELYPEALL